jgi:hypothetical protein
MKSKLLLLCICLLSLSSQTYANSYLSHQHAYYKYAAAIYEDLLHTSGDFSKETPRLEVWTLKSSMALYNAQKNVILLDSSIVGLCKRQPQGATALAFLLGHELVHFYKGHGHNKTAFAASKENFHQHQHHENQADRDGAFLAYMAGYDVLEETTSGSNVVADFLQAAYQLYELEEEVKGYLPLPDRQKAAAKVLHKTEKLIQIYNAGNRFAALDMNLQAQACFQYLVDSANVKNKHLLNNLAIAKLQVAKAQTKVEAQPYLFPTLLNTEDKILGIDRAQGTIFEPIHQLLPKTLNYYREIVRMDPNYQPAFLGYAYALMLGKIHNIKLGEEKPLEKALEILKHAKKTASSREKAYFELAEGVIWAQLQKSALAQGHFQQASALAPKDPAILNMAHYNSSRLRGDKARGNNSSFAMSSTEDAIGLYNPLDLQDQLLDTDWSKFFDQNYALYKNAGFQMQLWQKEKQGVEIFSFQLSRRQSNYKQASNFLLIYTRSAAYPTKAGARVGQSLAQLEKLYPNHKLLFKAQQNGTCLIIPELNIYFLLDEDQKVIEWGLHAN